LVETALAVYDDEPDMMIVLEIVVLRAWYIAYNRVIISSAEWCVLCTRTEPDESNYWLVIRCFALVWISSGSDKVGEEWGGVDS